MRIRRAHPKDINHFKQLLTQVNAIHHSGRPDLFKLGVKYDGTELKEIFTNPDTPVFVAVNEGDAVVGYVFCRIIQVPPRDSVLRSVKTLYIDDLCVDEQLRGKHIGTRLLNYVFDYAEEAGFHNVTLNVYSFNEDAIKFYTDNGMKPQKLYMEKRIKRKVKSTDDK